MVGGDCVWCAALDQTSAGATAAGDSLDGRQRSVQLDPVVILKLCSDGEGLLPPSPESFFLLLLETVLRNNNGSIRYRTSHTAVHTAGSTGYVPPVILEYFHPSHNAYTDFLRPS